MSRVTVEWINCNGLFWRPVKKRPAALCVFHGYRAEGRKETMELRSEKSSKNFWSNLAYVGHILDYVTPPHSWKDGNRKRLLATWNSFASLPRWRGRMTTTTFRPCTKIFRIHVQLQHHLGIEPPLPALDCIGQSIHVRVVTIGLPNLCPWLGQIYWDTKQLARRICIQGCVAICYLQDAGLGQPSSNEPFTHSNSMPRIHKPTNLFRKWSSRRRLETLLSPGSHSCHLMQHLILGSCLQYAGAQQSTWKYEFWQNIRLRWAIYIIFLWLKLCLYKPI